MPAKFKVEFTLTAEGDIGEIWAYITADNPERASQFIRELENQTGTLEHLPQRCPLIPENELLGTEYRHLIYGNYRTLFQVSGKIVYILRILHGSRLLDSTMFDV